MSVDPDLSTGSPLAKVEKLTPRTAPGGMDQISTPREQRKSRTETQAVAMLHWVAHQLQPSKWLGKKLGKKLGIRSLLECHISYAPGEMALMD